MHVLQNPDDAPDGMQKMLDRKRKRSERPLEKRARRKYEQRELSKITNEEKRRQSVGEGTWDAEQAEEDERMKEINRQANEFILQAQRQGLIQAGPNEIRKGIVPTGANAVAMQGQPNGAMQEFFKQSGLSGQFGFTGNGESSLKAQKHAREKAKRQLKRAAKAYLLGEEPPHEETAEDREAKKKLRKKEDKRKRKEGAIKNAEKMAKKAERHEQSRAKRVAKKARRDEMNCAVAEQEAAEKAGLTVEEYQAEQARRAANGLAGLDDSAEKFRFELDSRGRKKKIPGVGPVNRYPTKAEKNARKIKAMALINGVSEEDVQARIEAEREAKRSKQKLKVGGYRAMQHGMSLDEYQKALAEGRVHHPWVEKRSIPPKKLAEYQKRADEKGLSLQEYIKRRERKIAQKQAQTLGHPFQQDMHEPARRKDDYIATEPAAGDSSVSGALEFVHDTTGDETLAALAPKHGDPLAVVDSIGDETLQWRPGMVVPLDPRIWEGHNAKELPKEIRKARKEWLRQKREEKKATRNATGEGKKQAVHKKPRGQRKVETRETFVRQILNESRKAKRFDRPNTLATIEGVENVPLVKLQTSEGLFTKLETNSARTIARRVLRTVKRDEKAKGGKGKGYKKKERRERERERNAGISASTTRPRLDGSVVKFIDRLS